MAEVFDFGLQQHKIKMDGKFFENNLFAVAGDTGRRLEIQLLDANGLVQNTTGLSLRLNANIAGQVTYAIATLVDATKGLYELDLPNGMLMAPGDWQFQWQIIGTNGDKLHSFAFTGTIGSNLSEGGTEATNFYLNVDQITSGLVEFKEIQGDLLNRISDAEFYDSKTPESVNFSALNTSTNILGTSYPPTNARMFIPLNIPIVTKGKISLRIKTRKQVEEYIVLLQKVGDKYNVVDLEKHMIPAGINQVSTNLEVTTIGEFYIGVTDSVANFDGTIGNLYYSSGTNGKTLMVFNFNANTDTSVTVSSTTTATQTYNKLAIEITVSETIRSVVVEMRNMGDVSSIPKSTIYTEKFNGAPTPELGTWTTVGTAWTYNNGAIPVSSSTYANYLYWKQVTNFDADTVKYRIKLTSISSKFRIARISTMTSNLKTTTAEFDNGKLKLYEAVSGFTNPSAVVIEKDVNFTLIAGREYQFVLDSYGFTVKFMIIDTVTGQSDSIEWDNGIGKASVGLCHDYPSFALASGSVVIKQFDYFTKLDRSPKILIISDSIGEGFTIKDVANGGDNARWTKKIYNDLDGKCTIMGVGNETSASFLPKIPLMEKAIYRPEYVLLELMTNDSDFATWKTTFDKLVTWCDSVGAVPVVCMMPMRAGRESLYDAILYYVENSKHKVIWFNRLLTVNGDGKTKRTDYDLDGLHPNVLGHQVMHTFIKATLPEAFPLSY